MERLNQAWKEELKISMIEPYRVIPVFLIFQFFFISSHKKVVIFILVSFIRTPT